MESERVAMGQVVLSKAGRDKDSYFIVVEITGNGYVLISDGYTRKIENPKRKKLKHLVVHSKIAYDIKDKIEANMKLNNGDINNCLKSLGLVDQSNKREV